MNEPYAIAVLPDHPTPIKTRTHSRDPVPFVIASPNTKPDGVKVFDEFYCQKRRIWLSRKRVPYFASAFS